MKHFFFLLLFCSMNAVGQQVYQLHEVDTPASPTGGPAYFAQFLNANLRIPFKSAVKGINARVFIKAVVELDGRVSEVQVLRGLDSLCNKEAARVFGLFNTWTPAMVKGNKVRQAVNIQIPFKAAPQTNYDSTSNAIVEYYDSKYVPTSDPKKYGFRTITPIDDRGYLRDDVVYEEMSGKKWKNIGTAKFSREDFWYKSPTIDKDSVEAYRISAKDQNNGNHATEMVFQKNGLPLSYKEFGNYNKATLRKEYDLRGMVRTLTTYGESANSFVAWYENGQIASVREETIPKPPEVEMVTYIDNWDPNGKQLVVGGEGYWKSVAKTFDGKIYAEEGAVKGGRRQGKWIGKWTDSSLYYEENYENGALASGYAMEGGEKYQYTTPRTNPQFKGGTNAMYRFLGSNIQYPYAASTRGIGGRVNVSFTVCEDGSVCDYIVENPVGFGMDDEAMRVVKKMSGQWEPGTLRGKPVRVRYHLPINFATR